MNPVIILVRNLDNICSGSNGYAGHPNPGCTLEVPTCNVEGTACGCNGVIKCGVCTCVNTGYDGTAETPHPACNAETPICYNDKCVKCSGTDGNSIDWNLGCSAEKPTCNSAGTECKCTGLGLIANGQCTLCNTNSGNGTTGNPHNGCDASSSLCSGNACVVCTGSGGVTPAPNPGCSGSYPTCNAANTECQCLTVDGNDGTVDKLAESCTVCTVGSSPTPTNPDTGCNASFPACEAGGVCKRCYGSGGDPLNPNVGCESSAPVCTPEFFTEFDHILIGYTCKAV